MKNINIDDIKVSSKLDNTIDEAIKKGFDNSRKPKGKKSALIAGIAAATILTVTFPSYAQNLPVVGDIFKELNIFNSDLYSNYKEYSQELNLTEKDNGVSITIVDAVFDGRTINLTYEIKSDKDLGEDFSLVKSFNLKGYSDNSYNGSSYFKKIDDYNYIGQENFTVYDFLNTSITEANIDLSIREINLYTKDTSLKGKWNFKFKLTSNRTDEYGVNETVEKDGIKFTANTLTINSMNIFLKTYHELSINLIKEYGNGALSIDVKDDLNNTYSVENTSQSGDLNYANSTFTISKLKDGAKKLIISPKVKLNSTAPIVLDDIIVELNTLDLYDSNNTSEINTPLLEDNLIITNNSNIGLKKIEFYRYDNSEVLYNSGAMMYADGSLIAPGDEIGDREYGKFSLSITDENDKVSKSEIFDFTSLDSDNNTFKISIEKDSHGNWCFILK